MSLNGQAALDWAKHEGEILDLFVTQSKTLNEVMAYMKEKHNFQATERQYKYRFPSLKNVKAKEWIWFDQEMQRRAAEGKESEPCLYGRPLPPDRVIREIARHQKDICAATPSNQVPNPSPQRISVRTPPPNIAIHSELNLDPLDDLMDYNLSSSAPQVSVPESLAEQASLEVAFGQERLVELDAAIAIEPEIEDNLSHFSLPSEWTFDADFSLAMANRSSPGMIVRRTPSFSAGSTTGPRFAGQSPSPFFQFVNLEIFDTRPGSHLMTNLPCFRLQSILDQPEYILQVDPAVGEFPLMPTSNANSLPTHAGRDALWNLLGSASELQLQENIPQVTSKLQRLVPERYEGELSEKVGQLLNPRSTGSSSVWFLFGLAAYFASNNTLADGRMDAFLKWVIDQKYSHYLERLLQIDTPTIHAFAIHVLKSAVRIKNTRFLTALLDYGVKFDNILDDIFSIGDMEFTKLVLSRVDPTCYRGTNNVRLFHRLVNGGCFELARMLVQNGASVDGKLGGETLLYYAASREMVHTVIFLLDLGANVNTVVSRDEANTALGVAVARKNPEIVALLLEHDASTSCKVEKVDLLEWSSLHCRNIYSLLKEKIGSSAVGVTIGDLVHAANRSSHSLRTYIHSHPGQITKHQFERALHESIRLERLTATVALLQYGVSPDCHTLDRRPLWTALDLREYQEACDLLIGFQATVNVPGILKKVVQHDDIRLLQTFVKAGVNLEEQGIEALVASAPWNHTTLAAFLIHSGVDVNTPGLEMTPLQAAAQAGHLEMIELLLSYGANINAPAYLRNGYTALQRALRCDDGPECASLLLDKGADISAPPASLGGWTALEAICHHNFYSDTGPIALCNRLLDLGAPVNRPNGEPSSALHGVISNGWDEILARMLEPQRNAVTNYMWCDMEMEEEEGYRWEPRTPIQLAAEYGRLKYVRMLLDHGADINEASAYRFGRTALQAAASNGKTELVKFLLEEGAEINAKPAAHGGITALQGAAVFGNVMLAKLLLDKGADVNAAPSFSEGRYAIEAAAEHGRLDMVQLLLNAGAMGNVFHGTGFEYSIGLAKENGHFAIANLLENVTQAQE